MLTLLKIAWDMLLIMPKVYLQGRLGNNHMNERIIHSGESKSLTG